MKLPQISHTHKKSYYNLKAGPMIGRNKPTTSSLSILWQRHVKNLLFHFRQKAIVDYSSRTVSKKTVLKRNENNFNETYDIINQYHSYHDPKRKDSKSPNPNSDLNHFLYPTPNYSNPNKNGRWVDLFEKHTYYRMMSVKR